MSAAPELTRDYVPLAFVPDRDARSDGRRLASVTALHAPAASPAVRITRRGVTVLAVVVALVCGAMLWWAARSAPAPAAPRAVPTLITVHSGDTLWSIAQRIAPQRDPRAEVAALVRLNHLSDVDLTVGQTLHTR